MPDDPELLRSPPKTRPNPLRTAASNRLFGPRRPRLRFTLRLLLAAVTVTCVWLAIHTQRARQQQQVVQHIQAKWGSVTYDYDHGLAAKTGEGSPVPRWLLSRLGKDFFHSVTAAHVRGEVNLAEVAKLSSLEDLTIWKEDLTDADMEHVTRLCNLLSLVIQSDKHQTLPGDYPDTTHIGDGSLAILATLPRLQKVYLDGYHFTGRGLAALATSRSLREINVRNCDASVTATDVEPLRKNGLIKKLAVRRWTEANGEEVVASW
jgi:hypothetical protein